METRTSTRSPLPKRTLLADEIGNLANADVLLFNAETDYGSCFSLIKVVRARPKRRKNLVLILVTNGGDPNAAYKIARFVKINYEHVRLLVPGFCKSSGTLIAVSADTIVMSDYAELGPLDIQIPKHDDFGVRDSGLTAATALDVLRNESFATFETVFLKIKARSRNQVSFKTATEVASALTVGLFQPISQQIQAMHLGEVERASRITEYYGKRLASSNVKENAIERLANGYPSHGFVIDREEARQFFRNVELPTESEIALFDDLGDASISCIHNAAGDHVSCIEYLSSGEEENNEIQELREQHERESTKPANNGKRQKVRDSSPSARSREPAGETAPRSRNGRGSV